jgi:hypothetical protein
LTLIVTLEYCSLDRAAPCQRTVERNIGSAIYTPSQMRSLQALYLPELICRLHQTALDIARN